jgi:hypothetical protein
VAMPKKDYKPYDYLSSARLSQIYDEIVTCKMALVSTTKAAELMLKAAEELLAALTEERERTANLNAELQARTMTLGYMYGVAAKAGAHITLFDAENDLCIAPEYRVYHDYTNAKNGAMDEVLDGPTAVPQDVPTVQEDFLFDDSDVEMPSTIGDHPAPNEIEDTEVAF